MNNEERILTLLESLAEKVDGMDKRLINVESGVRKTNMIIENEIRPDIRLITEAQRELYDKVKYLPEEVEDVKESVSILKFVQQEMAKKNKA